MKRRANNYAFIDSQNVHLGVRRLGWKLDWRRLRVYLEEKYGVSAAYLFTGYLSENRNLYRSLRRDGYLLMFKRVLRTPSGRMKGNVDAELVLQAMIEYEIYDRAIIITSDGDFACLVRHLRKQGKLERVLSPSFATCSLLLKREAQHRIDYLDSIRRKLEYRQ